MAVNFSEYQQAQKKSILQILGWLALISLFILVTYFVIYQYYRESQYSRFKQTLMQTVEVAVKAIEPIRNQVRMGAISPEQGIDQMADVIRRMTYTDDYGQNYIFLVDYDGVIVVNPFLPEREGSNQWDMKDQHGKYIIRSLIETAQKYPDGGFDNYYYLPPNGTEEEEKYTYVVNLPEVKALIGTGIYLSQFTRNQQRFILFTGFFSFLIILLISYPITLSVRRLREAASQIQDEISERQSAEANTQTVFEGSRDAMLIMNDMGTILITNPAASQLLGLPEGKLVGYCLTEVIAAEETEVGVLQMIHDHLDQIDEPSFEWQFTRMSDRQPLYVDISLAKVTWSGQVHILASIRDVTDRKILIQEIKRNNLLLEKAQRLAQVGHFYFDLITREIIWSKEMYRIADIPVTDSAPGLLFQQEMMVQDGWEKILSARDEITRTGRPVSFDVQIKLKSGAIRDISITMDPVSDEETNFIAIAGAVQDVTERNLAAQALLVSESRFITAIENIPYEVWAIDENANYVIQNMISQNRWGDLKGKSASDGQIPPDFAHLFNINNQRVLQGELINEEFTRMDNGVRADLLLIYSPIRDGDKILGGFGLNIDLTEQKAAQERVLLELGKIEMLREIDKRIIGHMDVKNTFEFICTRLVTLVKADAVSIHLYNPERDVIEPLATSGFKFLSTACLNGVMKNSLCWHVLHSQAIITDSDPKYVEWFRNCPCIVDGGFRGYIGFPISSDSGPSGVLELHFNEKQELSDDWINFLLTVAGQAAIVLDNTFLYSRLEESNRELETAYEATITGWSHALELRDKETKGHSERVLRMAVDLARQMGITEPELVHFRRGVLLHDIGKMGIPDNILLKPASLTDDEWVIMRKHPQYAYDLLKGIDYLRPSLEIPYRHHERWNGSGYPGGLSGEEIPLPARIFAVVDVWDALISDRPYRPGWSQEEVIHYLRQNAGILFDPLVVERTIALVTTPGYLDDENS